MLQKALSKNIAANCEQLEAESHQEYLLKVLQNELEYRQTARKNRLIKQAGFYGLKSFSGYCFDEIKLPSELLTTTLTTAAFVAEKKNLICYGNVGTGNYEKKWLMERNEVTTNKLSGCGFISFHNTSE